MATLKQITDNLKGIIRGGDFLSDDEVIKDRQLEFIVNYIRAFLIRQNYEKGYGTNNDVEQDLGCVAMELVDPAECCEITTSCSFILRTIQTIPRAVETHVGTLLTYIGSIDKTSSFQLVNPARMQWQKYSKYTGQMTIAYKLNDRIYIANNKFLEYINIRGVFETPREAGRFTNCSTGTQCYTPDMQYPISTTMMKQINDAILSGELKIEAIMRSDTSNNAMGANLNKEDR